ncbi:MAG TPA: flagellar motor switch protein FliN [Silvibacterium sp.]|nr:flagellar motor switch protein FliN [Silvibacterium sp.]
MSETAAAPGAEPIEFISIWAEAFSQVLGQITGAPVACVALNELPASLAAASESDLWIGCALSGGVRGEMCLRLPGTSTLRLAQIFMSEPTAPEAELTADHREAALELIRQIAGLVTSALKPRWGESQLRPEAAAGPPSWTASATQWLRVGEEALGGVILELWLSAALAAALRSEKAEPEKAVAQQIPPAAAAKPDERVNLDLLMDVDLAVTLRFGSRRLPLREVLDLNPGSVVELDREVQQPVDLLLDGRLVGRGQVVVIEGNYGLRVTEVAPPDV